MEKEHPSEQEPLYTIADLRRCFTHVGTATFQHYMNKAWVPFEMKQIGKKGNKERAFFKPSGVVHSGVIVQLSSVGAFQGGKVDVTVDHELGKALERPEEIIAFYEREKYLVAAIVHNSVTDRISGIKPRHGRGETKDTRAADSVLVNTILFVPLDAAKVAFEQWSSSRQDDLREHLLWTVAFVDVHSIARHVSKTLGAPNVPRRRVRAP